MSKDPYRFAGRMGIDTGPVPLKRWRQQPSVQVTQPVDKNMMPDAGKVQEQLTRPEKKGRKR